jgi:hypothetical protein
MTKARDLANGGFGLVLVKPSTVVNGTDNGKGTVTISAQTSVSLNNVFSSTYENYEIILGLVSGTVEAFSLRLRASGSDNTTSNYYFTGTDLSSSVATVTLRNGDPSSSFRVGTIGNDFSVFKITLSGPQTTSKTSFVSASGAGNGTNEGYGGTFSGFFSGTTQFDGLTIIGSTSFSGTASVYGYNK